MAAGSKRVALLGFTVLAALIFVGLGVWQVQRLAWKTALIEQVEARSHAAPIAAPASIDEAADAYRAVRVEGRFRHDQETLVKAVTDLGPGFWVMTPMETDQDFTVLVNRGFVPEQTAAAGRGNWSRPSGPVAIPGLIRLSEPGGGFLRANDPAGDRWFSRDVQALARARTVAGAVAPYFIDAAADPASSWPRGGLTVIRFSNTHLIYALTWFGLAVLSLFAAWHVLRERSRPTGDEG